MPKGIAEILKEVSEQKDNTAKKIMLAQYGRNQGVMTILKLAFDPEVKFNLPEGDPPYKPCQYLDQQTMLYNSIRRMYLFIGEGNPNLSQKKREMLFINLIESLDPEDAKLLCAVKDKKMPYKGVTKKLVQETFPGLIKG
jgi:hypothetical protein